MQAFLQTHIIHSVVIKTSAQCIKHRPSAPAGQRHQWTFSLLLSAEIGEESSCVTCNAKEITQPTDCVFYVGVAVDEHSTLLIKVSLK